MPIKLSKTGMRMRLLDTPAEVNNSAMPEIVLTLVRLAQELAPKHTGKMASRIEGKIEHTSTLGPKVEGQARGRLYWVRGTVTPRGTVAHLVHNPTHRGMEHNTEHKAMRFWAGGHWVLSKTAHPSDTKGRPFLQWAATYGQDDAEKILQKHAERVLEKVAGSG